MTIGSGIHRLQYFHAAACDLIGPRYTDDARNFSIHTGNRLDCTTFSRMSQAVREHGRSSVMLIANVSGPEPRLDQVWLVIPSTDPAALARGDDVTLLIDCKLWAPKNGGPATIVAPISYPGGFAVSADGLRLEHRPDKPEGDLVAGMRRAKRRIARIARSEPSLHAVSSLYASPGR